MDRGDEQDQSFLHVPDSPDARLFIELSSHASDLTEARHALELALAAKGSASTDDPTLYLVGFAVVAYCRTIMHSKVRRPLTDHVDLPEELVLISGLIKDYRNRTVAHSQSTLATTLALGLVDPATHRVKDVMAATMLTPLPAHIVGEFLALVEAMIDRLDEKIAPVRSRLLVSLAQQEPLSNSAVETRPEWIDSWAQDFSATTKRPPCPSQLNAYWTQE